jgi:hypothetical protein
VQSTLLGLHEFIRAGAAEFNELDLARPYERVNNHRFAVFIDKLCAELGTEMFDDFVEVVAQLGKTPQSSSDSANSSASDGTATATPSSISDIIMRGQEYEQEKYAHRCFGLFPNYTPHPAFLHLEAMALDSAAEGDDITQAIEHQMVSEGRTSHPWDGDGLYSDLYRPFIATWKEFQWRKAEDKAQQEHEGGNHDDSEDSESSRLGLSPTTGGYSSDDDEQSVTQYTLRSPTPTSHELPFTACDLVSAGVALDVEMQKVNCNRKRPNYNPHPAYTRLMEMWTQLHSSGDYLLAFIYGQLGRADVVEWLSRVQTFRVMHTP